MQSFGEFRKKEMKKISHPQRWEGLGTFRAEQKKFSKRSKRKKGAENSFLYSVM